MSDPAMLKIRGKACDKKYLSDSQGLCQHPEKKYINCVTALRKNKCPIDSGWYTFNRQQQQPEECGIESIDDQQDYIIKGKVLRDVAGYAKGSWVAGVVSRQHPSPAPEIEQDVEELFRKEIAKWKDEDPLFTAYVHGQEAGRKEATTAERERDQKHWQELEDYINANSPWVPGTDDRVTDARKLIAKVRFLRSQPTTKTCKKSTKLVVASTEKTAPSRCACGEACTGHREIGVCPQARVEGKETICQAPDFCEYQCWDPGITEPVYCGRESAALKMAEEPADLPPAMPENLRERLTRSIDKEHPSEWEKGYLALIERIFKDENCDKTQSK